MVREIVSALGSLATQSVVGTSTVAWNTLRAAYTSKSAAAAGAQMVELLNPATDGAMHHVTNFVSQNLGEGIRQAKTAGLFTEIGSILKTMATKGIRGTSGVWEPLGKAIAKTGIKGGLVIGTVGALGLVGYGIFKSGFFEGLQKWWGLQHGHVSDMCDSEAVWGILTASKGIGLLGALMTLFPPTTILGISAMLSGGAVAFLTDKYRKLYYGTNWITAPEVIQLPFAEGIAHSIGKTSTSALG